MEVRPPTGDGRRFEAHVFVCTEGPNCPADGPAAEILKHLKTRLKETEKKGLVRFNKSGCLDQCGHGPMLVVYPEGTWYGHLSLQDADRIFDEHIMAGRPVADLVYQTGERNGKNKLPTAPGVAPDTSRADYFPCARCPWGPRQEAP